MSSETIVIIAGITIIGLFTLYGFLLRKPFKELRQLQRRRSVGYVNISLDERMTWAAIILSALCVVLFAGLIATVAMKFIPIVPVINN